MDNIVNVNTYILSAEEEKDLKQMVEKVNTSFVKTEEKKEYDLLLHKEYNRLMQRTFSRKWLKGKELKRYIALLKTFHLEDEYVFSLIIMLFTSLVASDKRILDTKESYIYLLIDVFLTLEIPLTRYSTYLSCLLEEGIPPYFERERLQDMEPRLLLMVLMEDVNFFHHKDQVMDDLKKELDDRISGNVVKKNWFIQGATVEDIYQKVKQQMVGINSLVPIYTEKDFKRLKNCKKLRYLAKDKQEEFLRLMQEMDVEIPSLKEKIHQILIVIDIYSMSIVEDKVITPPFGLERKK